MPVTLKVKRLDSSKGLPQIKYQTNGAAGIDLVAAEDIIVRGVKFVEGNQNERNRSNFEGTCFDTHININRELISTGICLEIPEGYYGAICARSGLAVKHGINVAISVGVIDCDYKGEIKVLLINTSNSDFEVKRGDRIAQIVIQKYEKVEIQEVDELTESDRGSNGFGSTGINL